MAHGSWGHLPTVLEIEFIIVKCWCFKQSSQWNFGNNCKLLGRGPWPLSSVPTPVQGPWQYNRSSGPINQPDLSTACSLLTLEPSSGGRDVWSDQPSDKSWLSTAVWSVEAVPTGLDDSVMKETCISAHCMMSCVCLRVLTVNVHVGMKLFVAQTALFLFGSSWNVLSYDDLLWSQTFFFSLSESMSDFTDPILPSIG